MVKKLAIDWDDHELRYVAAQCSGRSIKVTEAKVISIQGRSPQEAISEEFQTANYADTETLVAIGRGKAELRELQLPPVPQEELPDMVRFQALRSFATVGENSTVDYLVTKQLDAGIEVIAAAVAPQSLEAIRAGTEPSGLRLKRIGLRPLAAAALHLARHSESDRGEVVLIDLLPESAEIVIARDGQVVFVRTVRMPSSESARAKALAGELKRSLLACGVTSQLRSVILWGTADVHADEIPGLEEAAGCSVQVINPFDLVDSNRKLNLPKHVGRLAPLIGLLLADEVAPERLIDFLNPRKPEVKAVSPYRKLVVGGIPVAACALLAFIIYQRMANLDSQIEELRQGNSAMQADVKLADESLAKTETVDAFLDGDVNWLSEIRRMAMEMPPSDQMIIRGVSASVDARKGGGTLKIEGGAVNPAVIDEFEKSLRDENHQVSGTGASEQKTEDAYRWEFSESIAVTASSIRDARYIGISEKMVAATDSSSENGEAENLSDSPPSDSDPDAEKVQSPAVAVEAEDNAASVAEATTESDDSENETTARAVDAEPAVENAEEQVAEESEEVDGSNQEKDVSGTIPEQDGDSKEESEATESLEVANVSDAEVQR